MTKRTYRAIVMSLLFSLTIFLVSACNKISSNTSSDVHKTSTYSNCRLIQQAMEEVCIPTNPQRVVTLSIVSAAIALDLGVKPVGSTNFYQTKPAYLKDQLQEIEILGRLQPNLEKMLLIKPDLILGWKTSNQEIYALLANIAPTILLDYQGGPSWREHFNSVAKVLEKEDVARQAWNSYYQRVEELKLALGNSYQDKTISFIHLGDRGIESDVKNSFAGSILNDVGLKRPETQNTVAPYGIVSISEEELDRVDGDVLFVTTWSDRDKATLIRLQQKALWQQLRAVQQNNVYFVNFPAWTGSNLLAANVVLDDLYKYLVNKPKTGSKK